MLFRALFCCTALILALLFGLNAGAGPTGAEAACRGNGCRDGKPLDLMQFMREQAASTRAAARAAKRRSSSHTGTQQPHRRPHAVAEKSKEKAVKEDATPQPVPGEAAASFASQAIPEVQVVSSDEVNAIDLAGEAAPPEAVGASGDVATRIAEGSGAESRYADERKDTETSDMAMQSSPPPGQPDEEASWMEWLWSGVTGMFSALSAAVRNLIGWPTG